MWVLSLPLELALKVGISHPLPPIAVPPAPLLCEGASPLTNPALSPFTDPTQYPLLNAEGAVLQPIGVAVGHTFPSGYTVRLAFFAVLAGYWLWSRLPPPWRTVTSGLLVIVALLLALSRLVVIWHWPSDVLGGLALGGALGCAAHAGWALTWPRPRSTWPRLAYSRFQNLESMVGVRDPHHGLQSILTRGGGGARAGRRQGAR